MPSKTLSACAMRFELEPCFLGPVDVFASILFYQSWNSNTEFWVPGDSRLLPVEVALDGGVLCGTNSTNYIRRLLQMPPISVVDVVIVSWNFCTLSRLQRTLVSQTVDPRRHAWWSSRLR